MAKKKIQDALAVQVGGSHYKDVKIQPVEFAERNRLSFCEGSIFKYICRWRKKNGVEDVKKAEHFTALLLQMTKKRGSHLALDRTPSELCLYSFMDQFGLSDTERSILYQIYYWRRGSKTKREVYRLRAALAKFETVLRMAENRRTDK